MRSTMDIDANITGMDFNEEEIKKMVNEIALINLDDNVTFTVDKEDVIREDNEYGGFSYKIIGQFSNIVVPFYIDISTGDIITPRAIEYKYKTLLENEYIDLYTYNYETIIAEKLQTILSRGVSNSRMKDYYDIYYFVAYKWNDVNIEVLKTAIDTTFKNRESIKELEEFDSIVNAIEENDVLQMRWKNYQEKYVYAKDINFEDVILAIRKVKSI